MKIERNELLAVLSEALDCVEKEVLGATEHHAKRVAWICIELGRRAGMTEEELSDLAVGALLHDNALMKYKEDYENRILKPGRNSRGHCAAGEKRLLMIPGCENLRGFVLYHHERADGAGPFGKKEAEIPYGAQLIHIANELDVNFPMKSGDDKAAEAVRMYVEENRGTNFGTAAADLFLSTFSEEWFAVLSDENVEKLSLDIPPMWIELAGDASSAGKKAGIYSLAKLFAEIIDDKSPFTSAHSTGIAQKATVMAEHYGYGEEEMAKLYLAGALHDVGKLMVKSEVLEKPGRLDEQEYLHIQSHAYATWRLLSKIQGLREITNVASYHHEKLNGTGYPFGKTAEQLGKKERLLACLDIYQALTEERPYKAGMTHGKAISILKEMAEKGELDGEIVADIDAVFGGSGEEMEQAVKTALFQCPVCGYIYEGDVILPGFTCPVCNALDSEFVKIM